MSFIVDIRYALIALYILYTSLTIPCLPPDGQVLPVREEVGEMGALLGAVLGLGAREKEDEVAWTAAEGIHNSRHSTSTSADGDDAVRVGGSSAEASSSLGGSLSLAQALVQRRRDQQQQSQSNRQQSQQQPPLLPPLTTTIAPPSSSTLFDLAAETHQVTAEKLQLYLLSHPKEGFPSRYFLSCVLIIYWLKPPNHYLTHMPSQ